MPGFAELPLTLAHTSGHNFQRMVSTRYGESVNGIRTRDAKTDESIRGNQYTFGNKVKLLSDETHGDGPVRLYCGSEIAFDELTMQVQSEGIYLVGIAKDFLGRAEHLVRKTNAQPNQCEGQNSAYEWKLS